MKKGNNLVRQPRFKRGQWIVWKETTSICRVTHQAQSPEREHWYAVYAPSTTVRFVGKESEFRPLNHGEMKQLKQALYAHKVERWDRILKQTREAERRERERRKLDNHDLVIPMPVEKKEVSA